MPARLRKSPRLFGGTPRPVRARRVRPGPVPGLAPVVPVGGLNQVESRIYHALRELRIDFQTQVSIAGGSVLGGARADFLLPAYRRVLDFKGPWHFTAYGQGRDFLKDLVYQSEGLRRISLTDKDLPRLKERILELIGRPIGRR